MPDASAQKDQDLQVRDLTIPAEEGQLSRVRDFVTEVCDEAGFSSRETNNTKLAVDEACTNIIKHAYDDSDGEITITIRFSPGKIEISLADRGKHFDFAGVQDPDLDQYVETGKKGGLGVFLINRLMDGVEYRAAAGGNELVMHKTSRAVAPSIPGGRISWRGSLRYKFTVRATMGLLFIIAAIWGYIFHRQSTAITEQRASQWLEERRVAQNVANRSKDLLVSHEQYSIEQTELTAFISKIQEGSDEISYLQVVDRDGLVLSSTDINEMFTEYSVPAGEVLLDEPDTRWLRYDIAGRWIRDIEVPVRMSDENGRVVTFGRVHLGVYEDVIEAGINDPRFLTTLIIVGFFLVGVVLITTLVSVFVKPIQVLTDGVRAIGQGSFDGKINVEGPAEIGAIAGVFNEITEKFKKAQESVLEQEKLQKEIEVAKQIQHALLPKKHPAVSGYDIAPYYQAAKEVGGDYYDFVQVDDDTLGVVVADVSGKGVPGSLVMTMIRTALRMEARGNKNASDVMSKMNDFVTDDMKKGMFVTMFYVILDSKNRIISYASAGHNPMILYRAEHEETFFLNPKGFPVGISLPDETLFRRSISLEKIKLKKDDMLLIYTDGVTEAMNSRRQQYGEDRLVETIKKYGHLHPTEFINKLEQDVKEFTGGEPQNDDITVVAVKEKLTADDVLFGIRKKLIDMVDVEGMSVKEACAKMKVSPSTYYRYKKRMATMGERGLRNKVLREDMALRRLSVEDRKTMLDIIREHPEHGAKRIAQLLNEGRPKDRRISEKMVYDELRRLNLNTKDLRIEYLRRNRLMEPEAAPDGAETPAAEETPTTEDAPAAEEAPAAEDAAERTSREVVEDFLSEVTGDISPPESAPEPSEPEPPREPVDFDATELGLPEVEDTPAAGAPGDEYGWDAGEEDIVINVTEGDGVAVFEVEGHLDSVTSSTMENRLKEVADRCDNIVVDLTEVSYISSGGWGIFVGEVKRLRERKGDIVLVGMTSEVYDVFELLGFSDIFESFADSGAAKAYFARPIEERAAAAPPPEATVATPSFGADVDDAGEPIAAHWESLQIEAATVGDAADIAVLSLRGIIDTISAEHLRDAIDKVINNNINKIVVDMSAVEYVSSGGWGTFTERLRELRRAGGDVKLFGMDPDVYYVFTMLGFNIVLSSFDILSDAIEDFGRPTEERPSEHPEQVAPTPPPAPKPEAAPKPDDVLEPAPEPEPEATLDPEAELEGFEFTVGEDDRVEKVKQSALPPETDRRVTWSDQEGVLFARLYGALDGASVVDIDAEVDERLTSKPPIVVFNFAEVYYASSVGWGAIARYRQKVDEWGGRIAICELRQELYEVFSLLEFHSFIPVYLSEADAVAALQSEIPAPEEKVDDAAMREVEDLARADNEIDNALAGLDTPEPEPPTAPDAPVIDTAGTLSEEPLDIDDIIGDEPASQTSAPSTPSRKPERDDTFVDLDAQDPEVDVDQAVSDERVDEDTDLRSMGWQKFGDRLRKRHGKRKKGKADEESHEDDEPGGEDE